MAASLQQEKKTFRPRPFVLLILDGWGHNAELADNAIAHAQKPFWDALCRDYTHTLISGSGNCVGLPPGQMGNSEVGHLNIGAGRIVHQDLSRIDLDIENKNFFQNEVLLNGLQQAKHHHGAVHLMGLLSSGGVHSHEKHWHAMLELISQYHLDHVFLHPFLDGRDTPPRSAAEYIQRLENVAKQFSCGTIASLSGRYYAMDRDKRWERIQQAYDMLTLGKSDFHATTALQALQDAYARGETDEFVQPTCIHATTDFPVKIADDDIIIFMNFRADRARELTEAFTATQFNHFDRQRLPALAAYICLTEYDPRFNLPVAFPPIPCENIFPEIISKQGLHQLRIAETEKYAHVTFFFNGGIETPYANEDRILIPSPKVATYDLQPQMSAPELTERLLKEIARNYYDVIICNFANADMVGHTGNMAATILAIQCLDNCLSKIIPAILAAGGECIITADHGNAEQMFDSTTNQPHTAHTSEPVPFIYIGRTAQIVKSNGKLSDVAPTMLHLLDIEKPQSMTGESLLKLV